MTGREILVTGGAGYIGSHAVLALREAGWRITVLDNLSTGSREQVPTDVELVVGNAGDITLVEQVLRDRHCTAVMHFAASVVVPNSFTDPLGYYRNNLSVTRDLLEACTLAGVQNFVLSSTAAIYGSPGRWVVDEETPPNPISPYGRSKLAAEWIVKDVAAATGLHYAIMRYFNVAGADPAGRVGQAAGGATHLIRVACEAALGLRDGISVFGTDYETPDGTCLRDFIHVSDLADAHVAALDYLGKGGESNVFNCGYGRGTSVREVAAAVGKVNGRELQLAEGPRRIGDPVCLLADNQRILSTLGWKPRRDQLEQIIEDTLRWERRRLTADTGK